jgi:hypothetical protein
MREIPALYEVAKQICHDLGMPWFDPRTGKKYPAPANKVRKAKPRKRKPTPEKDGTT